MDTSGSQYGGPSGFFWRSKGRKSVEPGIKVIKVAASLAQCQRTSESGFFIGWLSGPVSAWARHERHGSISDLKRAAACAAPL
jgi:hypothetical protein